MKSRYLWAAVILLATSAGAAALVHRAQPADVRAQVTSQMRTLLEEADPEQHNHAGHGVATTTEVVCGVRVYGYEPAEVKDLAEVRRVYGFHLCGVAEPQRPWDVAVKLAGPVILDMSTRPPGIQVVEATENVRFVDRLRQMFPSPYAEQAQKEALTPEEMSDLRRRYDDATR